jgi:hypothetical protein
MVWAPDRKEPERLAIGHCVPSLEQMDFAIGLGRALNLRVNEGGAWLVAWTDPDARGVPTRLAMGWVDRDGDMPFTLDSEESLAQLARAGIDAMVAQAHEAWREYRAHLADCEISTRQMIRQRKGEPMTDPRQIVPWDFG